MEASVAANLIGDAKTSAHESAIALSLLKSMETGDGKTPQTAFTAVDLEEERGLLSIRKKATKTHEFLHIDGHMFDHVTAVYTDGRPFDCYFSVDRFPLSDLRKIGFAASATPVILTMSNSFIATTGKRAVNTAEAHKNAATMLAGLPFPAAFEDMTTGLFPIFRHVGSGIVCADPVALFVPKAPMSDHFQADHAVGCAGKNSDVQITLYIYANAEALSDVATFKELRAQVAKEEPRFSGIETSPEIVDQTIESFHYRATHLLSIRDPEPRYLYMAAALTRGWVIAVRARSSAEASAVLRRTRPPFFGEGRGRSR